nr:MAG: polyprotein [Martellivirales sp.]
MREKLIALTPPEFPSENIGLEGGDFLRVDQLVLLAHSYGVGCCVHLDNGTSLCDNEIKPRVHVLLTGVDDSNTVGHYQALVVDTEKIKLEEDLFDDEVEYAELVDDLIGKLPVGFDKFYDGNLRSYTRLVELDNLDLLKDKYHTVTEFEVKNIGSYQFLKNRIEKFRGINLHKIDLPFEIIVGNYKEFDFMRGNAVLDSGLVIIELGNENFDSVYSISSVLSEGGDLIIVVKDVKNFLDDKLLNFCYDAFSSVTKHVIGTCRLVNDEMIIFCRHLNVIQYSVKFHSRQHNFKNVYNNYLKSKFQILSAINGYDLVKERYSNLGKYRIVIDKDGQDMRGMTSEQQLAKLDSLTKHFEKFKNICVWVYRIIRHSGCVSFSENFKNILRPKYKNKLKYLGNRGLKKNFFEKKIERHAVGKGKFLNNKSYLNNDVVVPREIITERNIRNKQVVDKFIDFAIRQDDREKEKSKEKERVEKFKNEKHVIDDGLKNDKNVKCDLITLDENCEGTWDKKSAYEIVNIHEINNNTINENFRYIFDSLVFKDYCVRNCVDNEKRFVAAFPGYGVVYEDDLMFSSCNYYDRYNWCYDGKNFIPSSDNEHYALVSEDTAVNLPSHFINFSRSIILNNNLDFKDVIKFVQGVPGCGKTTYIIDRCKDNDLVLTVTRSARDDFERRYKNKFVIKGEKKIKNIKTVDSFLINYKNEKYDKVYFDEAFMVHAGNVILVALLTGCIEMYCLADALQIPYVERNKELVDQVRYASLTDNYYPTEIVMHSYRIPKDVARAVSPFYNKKYNSNVTTSNEIITSLALTNAFNGFERDHPVVYMSFTQSEKRELLDMGLKNCYTVHEFQGQQSEHVIMYRSVEKESNPIYSNEAYVIVALTRHTVSFVYYTKAPNDMLSNIIRKSMRGGGVCIGNYVNTQMGMSLYNRFGVSNGITYEYDREENFDFEFLSEKFYEVDGGIEILQDYYDLFVPGSSFVDNEYQCEKILDSDLNWHFEFGSLDVTRARVLKDDRVFARPNLHTNMYKKRKNFLDEHLLALKKRNLAVPQLQGLYNIGKTKDVIVSRFFSNYFDENRLLDTDTPIEFCMNDLEKWLSKQTPAVINSLKEGDCINDVDASVYEFLIKPSPKPNMLPTGTNVYPALQTICAHPKLFNSYFGPLVTKMKEKILYALRDKFIINTDLSVNDFMKKLNTICRPTDVYGMDILEYDASKFDKSQGYLALEVEIEIMRRFGFPEIVLSKWKEAHEQSYIKDYGTGMKVKLNYQRKSGDSMTLLGNTIITMSTLSMVYDLDDAVFGLFVGDDSLIVGKNFCTNMSRTITGITNIEIKLFRYNSYYFCSRFLLDVDNCWVMVPDPLKLLTKLGRHDLVDEQHAREYRVSIFDNSKMYFDYRVVDAIGFFMCDRYGIYRDWAPFFAVLIKYLYSDDKFFELYNFDMCDWKGIRPKLDI